MGTIAWPSRYMFCDQVKDAQDRDLLEDPPIGRFRFRATPDNVQVTVRAGQRLWHIAHLFYSASFADAGSLAWVLAYYNNIPDMTRTLEEGTIIYGPSARLLQEKLLAASTEP